MPGSGQVPYLRVVRGEPTEVELVAVVTALAARNVTRANAAPARPGRSAWASSQRLMHQPVHAGPGAWQASARLW
ncbi:MAG TPA: acyl-CoA carboxylase subunit epsilon [Streptosporangiaceae bacterium]|nr:acyl-CoA carboxylase subunit epsilon [Streptosporangiaceae bacterium]